MGDYLCLSKEEVNRKFFEFIKELKKHESKNTINGIKFIVIGVDELDTLAGEGLV